MAKILKQLRLLLWKNFLLQARKPIATTFEILLPILFVAILLVIRLTSVSNEKNEEKDWKPFLLDSDLPRQVDQDRSEQWTVAFAPNDTRYYNIMMKELPNFLNVKVVAFENDKSLVNSMAVSYTHLTLPTICSV